MIKKKKKKSKLQVRKDNPNSKYWQKKAMGEWGRIVHLQTGCAICMQNGEDHGGKVEAHHLVTRNAPECKFDPDNGILLCTWHHKFSPEISAHKAPAAFLLFLQEFYPREYEYMRQHIIYRPTMLKKSAKDWYEILEKLKGNE